MMKTKQRNEELYKAIEESAKSNDPVWKFDNINHHEIK